MSRRMLRTVFIFLCISMILTAKQGVSFVGFNEASAHVDLPDCRVRFEFRQIVATDQPGILASRFSEGQRVKKGDVCAKLRDELTRARFQIAAGRAKLTGKIERAKLAVVAAQAELDLLVEANRETPGTFPTSDVQRRRIALQLAELEKTVEEEELTILQLQENEERIRLDSLEIRSEIDGFVVRVLKNAGESLQQGESIIEIVNPAEVQIEGYLPNEIVSTVSEGDILRISVASRVDRSDTEALHEISGKVVFIDVSMQPVSKSVRFLGRIDNAQRLLREGMTVEVRIYTKSEFTQPDP